MDMQIPEVEPEQARTLGDEGAFLLDVREPDEWQAGHVADAVHIPMGDLQERQEEIPADRPVVAICRTGSRSAVVTRALNQAGYEAVNLAGGLTAWVEADLPIESADGSPEVI